MAQIPQYASTPKSPSVAISTANTNRDGTGTLGTLMTAGASGSRVDAIYAFATGNTTEGMLRFFIGTSLIAEVPVQASTPSGTVQAWSANIQFSPALVLESAAVLKVGTNNAESFVVTVINGGDF